MDISAPCRKGRSLLIILSAYDLRAGIDDGLTEFGVKANIFIQTCYLEKEWAKF